MEILILNKEEMEEVINMKDAIEADKLALKFYSSKNVDIPLRINLDIDKHNAQSLYMPGYVAKDNALGIKLVSVYPENNKKGLSAVPSLMLMVDEETGFPNCIMDGTFLTQLRTGALAGAATELLSKEDSSIFTLIGTGGQAEFQLEAILCVRDIKKVYVFDINEVNRKIFAKNMQEKFSDKYGVEIKECNNLEQAIKESHIITSVTTAKNATFNGDWVKKGTHINGVGSYTPEMAEIDESLILKSDKIYCDTEDALVESGDFVQLIERGLFKKKNITGELGDLILGNIEGRKSNDEITFFETTGNAVFDIIVGKKIYDLAKDKNIGTIVSI